MQKCHQTSKLQHLRQGVVEGWLELFSVSQTALDSCERTGLGETQRYAPVIFDSTKTSKKPSKTVVSRMFPVIKQPIFLKL